MSASSPTSRWRAGAIHLALSVPLLAVACYVMLVYWYPDPYFEASKAGGLLRLLIGINLVVGPLLTVTVYKQGKRGMLLDLVVIAALQLSAFGYGVYVAWEARPAYLVFTIDRFSLVFANQLRPESLTQAQLERFRSLPSDGPEVIGAELPTDPEERQEIMVMSSTGGVDIDLLPRYYVPYDSVREQVLANAFSVAELIRRDPDAEAAVNRSLSSLELDREAVAVLPMMAGFDLYVVLVSPQTGDPIAIVPADPWRGQDAEPTEM